MGNKMKNLEYHLTSEARPKIQSGTEMVTVLRAIDERAKAMKFRRIERKT